MTDILIKAKTVILANMLLSESGGYGEKVRSLKTKHAQF